jgi:orotidine-5'-phosphate decarboxylase
MDPIRATDRLIVALDVPSAARAKQLIDQLGETVTFYKVGLQLFVAAGPEFVRHLAASGKHVFLDLKLHDIPNTVASAIQALGDLDIRMITVHAMGGSKMLNAASQAAAQLPAKPIVLGVTVLTSMNQDDLNEIRIQSVIEQQVIALASMAAASGCGGIVASPQEAATVRATVGQQLAIVTPGVRPAGSDPGDQARMATPRQALAAGASHVVVGRPITAAPNPAQAAAAILAELA